MYRTPVVAFFVKSPIFDEIKLMHIMWEIVLTERTSYLSIQPTASFEGANLLINGPGPFDGGKAIGSRLPS